MIKATQLALLFKVKNSGLICCGYTEAEKESCEEDKSNPNAFIFSLTNKIEEIEVL